MTKATRLLLLGIITLLGIAYMALLQPLAQNPAYHHFADSRTILGINNFANVVSNLPFLLVGLYGLLLLKKPLTAPGMAVIYACLFVGVFCTGLGSAYYHYKPDNNTLVYDRLPMTIVFMSFFAATISGWIDARAGLRLLLPFLLLGIFSVLYWHHTEEQGAGDLRLYGFVQYYPMLAIPLIFLLFGNRQRNQGLWLLIWVIGWYAAAKVFEMADEKIFQLTGFISGHSLKHLAAAMATWYMLLFFKKKYLSNADESSGQV